MDGAETWMTFWHILNLTLTVGHALTFDELLCVEKPE